MTPGRRPRSGSSIVEVMVAVTILSVGALGLAGMALKAGHSARETELDSARGAVLGSLSELVVATPFEELTQLAGCESGGDAEFKYWYCVRIRTERPDLSEVTVMVEPDYLGATADSVTVQRSRGTASSPF